MPTGTLWFDALLKWETVRLATEARQRLLWFDALLKWETVEGERDMSSNKLWFDALLKWETVLSLPAASLASCDLMLYWNEKQYRRWYSVFSICCDLMLYWNEKQLSFRRARSSCSCDLMLYWNEKQWRVEIHCHRFVVIWCSIEMRNSPYALGTPIVMLWFDALLKWETVVLQVRRKVYSCDLMLYWNEKQCPPCRRWLSLRCDLMLYWNEKQWDESIQGI